MAIIVRTLTGEEGAGIGVGGTFFILFLGIGFWFAFRYIKKQQLLKKTQSATSVDATSLPTDKAVPIATTTNTSEPTYNSGPTMEMGTAEGNTHQLSTPENAHELDSPDRLHEMADLAPEYGADGDIHVEGDMGAADDPADGDMYPQGDHGKYEDGDPKASATSEDVRDPASTRPIAELEGDVAFQPGPGHERGRGGGGADGDAEGKESLGKGFVLTD